MAHAQKPDFVFRRNGRVHLIQRGASVQSTTGSRGVRISGSNAGYTMFRGSVKGTGYPLHSHGSPFTSPPVRHRVPPHFKLESTCLNASRVSGKHHSPKRRFLGLLGKEFLQCVDGKCFCAGSIADSCLLGQSGNCHFPHSVNTYQVSSYQH